MTKTRPASFNQKALLSDLRKQLGQDKFDEIRKSLRIKKVIGELSLPVASRLIDELLFYSKKKKSPFNLEKIDTSRDVSDMRDALRRIQQYVRAEQRVAQTGRRTRSR